MEDVTSLVLKVESKQVGKAAKELDGLTGASKKTEKATDGVAGAFKSLIAPLLAVFSATAALKKLVSITREFDILNAQLITSTGSAENAAIAFGAIQDFATETPFQLGEVTEAFVQLVNRGLDPSEESLTNIGNFASAFGRNILDATRAIGQATTGEFESLKQFGIVSKKIGDEVRFTFRGITTTVGFNAQEIQGYMNDLSANNFAGAMEARMDTLDGAMSNLEDSWDKMWLSISQNGSGGAIEEIIRGLTFAVEDASAAFTAMSTTSEGLDNVVLSAENIRDAFITVALLSSKTFLGLQGAAKTGEVAFLDLGNSLNTVFYGALINVSKGIESITDGFTSGINGLIGGINALPDRVKKLMGLDGPIEPVSIGFNIDIEGQKLMASAIPEALALAKAEWAALATELDGFDEKFIARMNATLEKLGKTAAESAGVLGQFINSGDLGGPTDGMTKAFEQIKASLLNEEDAIEHSYQARRGIITATMEATNQELANITAVRADILAGDQTEGTPEYLKTLKLREEEAQAVYAEGTETLALLKSERDLALFDNLQESPALARLQAELDAEYTIREEGFLEQELQITDKYDRDLELLEESLEKQHLTKERFSELETALEEKQTKDIEALKKKEALATQSAMANQNIAILSSAGSLASDLQGLAEEGSNAQKALFAVTKGIQIAQAILSTELAARQAAADPTNPTFFGKIAAETAIRALGYASVGVMSGTTIASFANGGIVPGGNFNGDSVTANVNSGEMILNFSQQKQLLNMASGSSQGGAAKPTVINIENFGGGAVEVQESENDEERIITIAVNRAVSRVDNSIMTGQGSTNRALKQYDRRRA